MDKSKDLVQKFKNQPFYHCNTAIEKASKIDIMMIPTNFAALIVALVLFFSTSSCQQAFENGQQIGQQKEKAISKQKIANLQQQHWLETEQIKSQRDEARRDAISTNNQLNIAYDSIEQALLRNQKLEALILELKDTILELDASIYDYEQLAKSFTIKLEETTDRLTESKLEIKALFEKKNELELKLKSYKIFSYSIIFFIILALFTPIPAYIRFFLFASFEEFFGIPKTKTYHKIKQLLLLPENRYTT